MNEELEASFEEIEELNYRFQKIISLVSDIENLNTISETEFLSKILKQAVAIVPEDDIYWAGLVHDIGKMLIPLEILNKKSKLSDIEYQVIKEHPVLGSDALKSSKSLQHIAKYVRHHHEWWNGGGYPDGLIKSNIPLESQVLCAPLVVDALLNVLAN